jgi:pantetheine-phosphate adenylyltransferase
MTVCVYAGTFDPFTKGHLSVVLQGCRLFEHVRILVAGNPKKTTTFTHVERVKLIQSYTALMPQVSVDATSGYVVKYAESVGATVLIRGIRNETDAKEEMALALENLKLAPKIQTVLLPSDPTVSHISSSAVKKLTESSSDYATLKEYLTPEAYVALVNERERVAEMRANGHL